MNALNGKKLPASPGRLAYNPYYPVKLEASGVVGVYPYKIE
jgi:hypothetical protein